MSTRRRPEVTEHLVPTAGIIPNDAALLHLAGMLLLELNR